MIASRHTKGVTLFRHILDTLPVEATLVWNQPVVAVVDGMVVTVSDGTPDRENICMAKDLLQLMVCGSKPIPLCSTPGGNHST